MTRNPSGTILRSLTEEEMAGWRREQGARIAHHRGHFWEMVKPGFYQTIHWLARLPAADASRPAPWCWGYRASLREADASAANAFMSVQLAQTVAGYDMPSLPSKRRNQLRGCQRQVEIVEVLHPSVLQEQAHEVYLSAVKRTGHGHALSRAEFNTLAQQEVRPDVRVVLAGLVAGKVGGYLAGSAVEGTAYIDTVILATEALSTNIGTGLVFEFMQICRRSGHIRETVYGLHSREDPALCKFKEEMGFPVVRVPTRVGMLPFLQSYIRWQKPHVHYRLFGE